MSYNVLRLSLGNPAGEVVGNYPTSEEAENTRKVLNETTPPSLLFFFIVKEVPNEAAV
jgi:hypothetical protein